MKIQKVIGREILDSRGNPTIEVDVYLENGVLGRASVPSGASTGSREALELRDNDNRFHGKGVKKAVDNINNVIAPMLIGQDSENQEEIDRLMIEKDSTDNKRVLGANAILGISIANLKASANSKGLPLFKYIGSKTIMPKCMMNILNGGMHADNNLDFQEFMIVPQKETIKENIRIGSEVFHTLKSILKEKGYATAVGDEGGFAPNLKSNQEALDLICEAIEKSGYILEKDVSIALDIAATSFYKENKYFIEGKSLTKEEMFNYYIELINKYPIISIEDPVEENDFEGFAKLTKLIGEKVQLVGDDLFVTNEKYLEKGINMNAGNAILIKPNQIGTVTEMLKTINRAKNSGYKTIISHRSGETDDIYICHFAVGLGLDEIKTGSMSRMDRICKYNELIRIEEYLN